MFSISFLFQISINNDGVALFLGTLEMVTRLVIQIGDSLLPIVFPMGVPGFQNKCARREYSEQVMTFLTTFP